jgi:putative acetyltransferase
MSADRLSIREDDLSTNAVGDLLCLHLEGMHAHSPPSSVFALDFSGLSAPNVTVWTVWQGDAIAGIGALKDLGERAGELKSMRTHPDFLRRGVAAGSLTEKRSQTTSAVLSINFCICHCSPTIKFAVAQ